jgi:hypothetical protein
MQCKARASYEKCQQNLQLERDGATAEGWASEYDQSERAVARCFVKQLIAVAWI